MGIQWRESLATGVEEIDNQHKELFNAINRLLDACSQGKGKEEVMNVVKFLEDYVITHFSMEEKLQQKYGYPEYTIHKGMHEKFIQDFLQLKNQIGEEGPNFRVIAQINHVVVDWLVKHIGKTDKALAAFLKTKM